MTKRNCNLKPSVKQGRPAITAEKFIEKARAVHGCKFSYPNVCYVNNKTKVEIECSVHKTFLQSPAAHLSGQGCPHCAKLITAKKVTAEQFIADAEKVHGKGRYDYSKVEYKGNKVKVDLICNRCLTEFQIRPNNHISSKSGCRVCKYADATVTQAEFVRRSELAHGKGRYNYDKAIYVKGCLKVKIFCNTCNQYFTQAPTSHMAGAACCLCHLGGKRYTQEEFVEKCQKAHGCHAYDYSHTVYTRAVDDIEVYCNTCNQVFTRSASSHSSGLGCSHCLADMKGCSRSKFAERCDFNSNGLARLYVIDCNGNGEQFYKVGITSHKVGYRLRGKKNLPYSHKVLFEIKGHADYIYNLETVLHRLVKHHKYKPDLFFTGRTECFTTIKPIEKLLKELSNTEQLQLLA